MWQKLTSQKLHFELNMKWNKLMKGFPGVLNTLGTLLDRSQTITRIYKQYQKMKSLKNRWFCYGLSTSSLCILTSFPSLDHQKDGPGNCLPLWHPHGLDSKLNQIWYFWHCFTNFQKHNLLQKVPYQWSGAVVQCSLRRIAMRIFSMLTKNIDFHEFSWFR